MRKDRTPYFRQIIVPWYDSDPACYIVMVFLGLILIFGFIGISVVREIPDNQGYIWVPVTLILLSVSVIISTLIRLMKRYRHRRAR